VGPILTMVFGMLSSLTFLATCFDHLKYTRVRWE